MRILLPITIVLLALFSASAQAQSPAVTHDYTVCTPIGDASIVSVAGGSCGEVTDLVTQLLAQPASAEPVVLAGAGWSPVRAAPSGDAAHDLVAIRGSLVLRLRRPGAAPDLDGWEAGRELILSRRKLVGGGRVPHDAVLCTSSFLIRLHSGRLGGLTAGHCGGLRKDRTVQRHNAALRRPPQPGIVLGRVLRILTRSKPLDALVLRIPTGANRPASSLVERGVDSPPWRIVGTAHPYSGRKVCMTGRTSGVDVCGRILGAAAHHAERLVSAEAGTKVRCTSIVAAPGDSGGPIYTAPTADGRVHAIGIATLIVRPGDQMCFTAIGPVLAGLHATLVSAAG